MFCLMPEKMCMETVTEPALTSLCDKTLTNHMQIFISQQALHLIEFEL